MSWSGCPVIELTATLAQFHLMPLAPYHEPCRQMLSSSLASCLVTYSVSLSTGPPKDPLASNRSIAIRNDATWDQGPDKIKRAPRGLL